MDDIAVLGFSVDSRELDHGTKALDKLDASAKKVETSASRMEKAANGAFRQAGAGALALTKQLVTVERAWNALELTEAGVRDGLRGLTRELTMQGLEWRRHREEVEKNNKALTALKAALAFLGIGLGLNSLVQYSDQYGILRSQIAFTTKSSVELEVVWQRLYVIAQQTAQGLKGTVELYARMERSTRDLGVSQGQLLQVVETLNKSLLIARVPAASAEAALFQLSQAFTAGALRGEELNSVIEQMPVLAEIIKNEFGRNFKQMASEGEITAERLISAILKAKDRIDSEFAGVFPSFSNALARLDNVMVNLIGRTDELAGSSQVLGEFIARLVSKMESPEMLLTLVRVMEQLTIVLKLATGALGLFLDNLELVLAGFTAVKIAAVVGVLIKVFAALRVAIFGVTVAMPALKALTAVMGTMGGAAAAAAPMIGAFAGALRFIPLVLGLQAALGVAAGAYVLYATSADGASKSNHEYQRTLANLGPTLDEITAKFAAMTKEMQKQETIRLGEAIRTGIEEMSEQIGKAEAIVSRLASTQFNKLYGQLFDPSKAEAARKALESYGVTFNEFTTRSSALVQVEERIRATFDEVRAGKITLEEAADRYETYIGSNEKAQKAVIDVAVAHQRTRGEVEHHEATLAVLNGTLTDAQRELLAAAGATLAFGDASIKAEENWAKFISKLTVARDTVGLTLAQEIEYQAKAQGFSDERVRMAVIVGEQTEALKGYESALKTGNDTQIEKMRELALKTAEMEASVVRTATLAAEMAKLAPAIAAGLSPVLAEAAAIALANEAAAAVIERVNKQLEAIQTNTKPDTRGSTKAIDQYRQFVRAKQADIKAEIALAEAYLQGREAVEAATKAREIEQEVLKHGEKHRAEIVKLLGAEADARKRSELAKAALDITEETSDIQAHAKAILEGTAALEEYNLQKEIAAAMAKKSAEGAEAEAEAIRKAARARAEAARGLDAAEEARRLVEATATPLEQYQNRLAELDKTYKEIAKKGPVSPEIAEAFRRARLEAEALQYQADPMAQVFKDAASDIHRAWTDLFDGIFDKGIDSFRDLVGSIGTMFKRMLAQMAALALARPILVPVMQTMGTALGVPAGAQAGIMQQMGLGGESGGFNPMSMLTGNSLGAAGSEILRQGATLAYKMGFEGAANTLGQSAMNLSSASNLSLGVGGFAGGMAGNFGANALFGDNRGMGASIGGAAGGAVGAMAGQILIPIPVVGAFIGSTIGSFLGNAVGGLFGGKPSDKAQWGHIDLATGRTFDVAGQTGKKFSQENADARDAYLSAAGELAQGLTQITGETIDKQLKIHIGSRDGLRLGVDGRTINFGSDPEAMLQGVMDAIIDAATGIKAVWKDVIKQIKGGPQAILQALQALQALDQSIAALTGDFEGLAEIMGRLHSNVDKTMDTFQEALRGGDANQIIAAMERAHQAVVARYNTEIQLATELKHQVEEIAAAARSFNLDVAGKINALQPSSEQQNLLTGYLNQALATAFAPEIQDKPDQQIGELSEALAVLDQWVAASKEAINQAINEQIRGLEDEKRLITDVTRERIDALQEELRLAQQWAGVLQGAKRLIEEMTLTRASPLPTRARLSIAETEVARLTEAFNGASGEEQVELGQDLLKALENQLTLAQEAFQRPSPEYMDAYNAIIAQVSALEGVAQSEADRAQAIQQEISYLNDLQVDLLAGIDAQIDYLREVAEVNLAAVNATAIELYRLIQAEGNRAYAQMEAQAQEQLNVLLQGQTYDQFIAERQAEAVSLLTQIRDGIQAALGVDGSHSSGLPYVPHNNYHAVLHEGEQVLTRDEARRYRDRDSQEGEAPAFAPPAARHAPPAPPMNITLAPQISLPAISINGGGDTQEVIREVRRVIARELPEQIKKTTIELLPTIRQKLRTA